MNELLPCPFCGGNASLDYDFNGIGVTYGIHCPECHCAIIDTGTYSKDEAITAWNRRAGAVPVVRGEWKQDYNHEFLGEDWDEIPYIDCSQCKHREWHYDTENTNVNPPNYCPHCGAKMEVHKWR